METYYVYIMASQKNGTLYTGVTGDLHQRVTQHKNGSVDGFTKKYSVKSLVYYETYSSNREAIHREKCLKEWKREWKIKLIEKENPKWEDLFPGSRPAPG